MSPNANSDSSFRIDHNLNIVAIDEASRSTLFAEHAECLGSSVWTVFQGQARGILYGIFKRLLGGEDAVTWQSAVPPSDIVYSFTATRDEGGYLIQFHAAIIAGPENGSRVNSPSLHGNLIVDADASLGVFFHHSPDPLAILTASGVPIQFNPAWTRVFGNVTSIDAAAPSSLIDLIHPEDRPAAQVMLESRADDRRAGVDSEAFTLICRCLCGDGVYRWYHWNIAAVQSGSAPRLFATGRDVTDSRAAEEEMRWRANHDPLTGLPNRTLLMDRLQYVLAAASRRHNNVAVLFLDLDRFKRINDTLGHAAGDQLLKEVAGRLRTGLRDEDIVTRLGGDEFVVVLPSIRDSRDASSVVDKLLGRISHPFTLTGHSVRISASIGVAIYPQDGMTPDQLLASADASMYGAKFHGNDRFALHGEGAVPEMLERMEMESRLSQALERQELLLHYQPQFCISTGMVVGVEALMRWNRGELGTVSPGKFIPLAEETGLILPIGDWAMREACRQAGDWRRAGFPIQIAVNLSARQLADVRFPDLLIACLQDIDVQPRQLEMELTEGTLIRNDGGALETLGRLKAMGIKLFVDDFGTGYANFSYLSRFPVDGVKVDRSFVERIDTNAADEAVVRAIVDLSHTLGLKVIAEGVETSAQRDKLLTLGCDVMQGHFFSAPVPPRDVTAILAAEKAPVVRGGLRPAPKLLRPPYAY